MHKTWLKKTKKGKKLAYYLTETHTTQFDPKPTTNSDDGPSLFDELLAPILGKQRQQFEVNMKNNLLISTLPSAICIAGIAFLHWGVFTGMLITSGVYFSGIANSIWPLLKYQKNRDVA